jgi:hypothetical protein
MTLSTLPPLNPMATAPRDGTRVIVFTKAGGALGLSWEEVPTLCPPWDRWRWSYTNDDGDMLWWETDRLLGWWPMPEARG